MVFMRFLYYQPSGMNGLYLFISVDFIFLSVPRISLIFIF